MISSSASRQSRLTSAGSATAVASASGVPDSRTSASRTAAGNGRPPRAHSVQTAPPRSGSQRNATSATPRPAKLPPPHAAQVSSTGPNPSRDSSPISNTRSRSALAPSPSSSRRNSASQSNDCGLDLAGRAQLAHHLRGVRGVRHPRHVGPERGVALGGVEPLQRQPARRPARSRSAADPSAHSDSPPANRRWLLRAPRASADTRPGVTAEQRDDAIRLAVVHRAQHDRSVRVRTME